MKIYQVWQAHEAADSDQFFPTKNAALECIHNNGGKGNGHADGLIPDCLYWETDNGVIYLQTHELNPTREEIARALTVWPNR